MTDKELAEEWIKEHSGLVGSYKFVKYDYDSLQQAYLAGAESREKRIAELEAQIEKMKEKLKADLIANLEEQMQYSTSPSCTKGMELLIKSIKEWEIKEND